MPFAHYIFICTTDPDAFIQSNSKIKNNYQCSITCVYICNTTRVTVKLPKHISHMGMQFYIKWTCYLESILRGVNGDLTINHSSRLPRKATEFTSRGIAGIFRGQHFFYPRTGGLEFVHPWTGGWATISHFFFILGGLRHFVFQVENFWNEVF